MKQDRDHSPEAADLRRRAEARLRELETQAGRQPPTAEEVQRLVHELRVHQIELELQNEELRESRDRLEENLERYTDLYDFAPVGYFTLTHDGTILELNFAGSALLGQVRFRLIGRRFGLFVTEEDRPGFNAMLDLTLAGTSRKSCDVALDRAGKPPCHVHLEGVRIDSGAERRCRLAATDITERKALEREREIYRYHLEELVAERTAELAASKAKFRGIVEQSLAGVMILQEGQFRYVNAGFAQMHGFDAPEQIVGRVSPAELIAPEERETVMAQMRRLLEGAGNPGSVVFTGLRRDGTRIALDVFANVIDHEGDRSVIALVVDITDRQRAEQAREAALAAAEHLARLKTEFLNNTSHELRTPLHTILTSTYLGQRAKDLPSARELFGHTQRAGQQLERLIQNLLDFSKAEAGQLTLAPTPCVLAEAIDRAVEPAAAQAAAKGLAFREERAPDLPRHVLADGRRLTQLLTCLLANAVKFTDQGQVAFSANRDGDRLVFRVADTGIGMPQDRTERPYRPFEPVDAGFTRRFDGLGLELALAHHFIGRMGGTIRAESALGRGSAFTVRLPLVVP